MGKGTIVSGGTDGQYSVTRQPDNSCITIEINRLTALIPEIEADITEAEGVLTEAEASLSVARIALDSVIAQFIAGTKTAAEVATAEGVYNVAVLEEEGARKAVAGLKLSLTSTETEITRLTSIKLPDITESLWCADKTEDLTGEVGLIEVNGQADGSAGVIIQPGDGDPSPAVYSLNRDGVVISPEAVGQATNYLFWGLRSCAEKYSPLYRVGVLSNLDTGADTGDVLLDDSVVYEQDINQSRTLTGVDIEYMTCNGGAFENGDRVLVKFEGDFTTPTIIGFESEPKGCGVWHLSGYVEGAIGAFDFMIAIGTLKEKGDEIIATPGNFRVTINSQLLTQISADSTSVEWEYDDGDLLYAGVFDEADCDEGPMLDVEIFGPANPYTVKLEELKDSVWTTLIDTSITAANSSMTTDPYLCVSTGHSGGSWTFTGSGVIVLDPDQVTWITIN